MAVTEQPRRESLFPETNRLGAASPQPEKLPRLDFIDYIEDASGAIATWVSKRLSARRTAVQARPRLTARQRQELAAASLLLIGIHLIVAGAFITFGLGISLMVDGVLLSAFGFMIALNSGEKPKQVASTKPASAPVAFTRPQILNNHKE